MSLEHNALQYHKVKVSVKYLVIVAPFFKYFGTKLKNQNHMHGKIKRRLN